MAGFFVYTKINTKDLISIHASVKAEITTIV
jgi:hypothetical protein